MARPHNATGRSTVETRNTRLCHQLRRWRARRVKWRRPSRRSRRNGILDRWQRAGLITRRSVSGRKIVFSARPAAPPMDASSPVNTGARQIEGTARIFAGSAVLAVHAAGANVHSAARLEARRAWSPNVLFALMILVAIGLCFVGLFMNTRFGKLTPEPKQIARIRIIGLPLIPILAGLAMMLGMALRREAIVS